MHPKHVLRKVKPQRNRGKKNVSSLTASTSSSSLTTSNKSNAKRRRDLYAAAAEDRQNNKRRHIEPNVVDIRNTVVSKQKDSKTQLSTTQVLHVTDNST